MGFPTMNNIRLIAKELRSEFRRMWITRMIPCAEVTKNSALIIAPHPDDETIGCGGLLAGKIALKVKVHVIFMTEGDKSLARTELISEKKVGTIRKELALKAMRILGVPEDSIKWIGLSDEKIPQKKDSIFINAVKTLVAEFERVRPEEIYCPHFNDAILDHASVARIVQEAVRLIAIKPRLIYYPVWLWFNSSWKIHDHIDISKAWKISIRECREQKNRALEIYFNSIFQPLGIPFCGDLPRSIHRASRSKYEVFFDEK